MHTYFEDIDPWCRPIPFKFEKNSSIHERVTSIERLLHSSVSMRRAKADIKHSLLQEDRSSHDKPRKRPGSAAALSSNNKDPLTANRRLSLTNETMENLILQKLVDIGADKQMRNAIFKLHAHGSGLPRGGNDEMKVSNSMYSNVARSRTYNASLSLSGFQPSPPPSPPPPTSSSPISSSGSLKAVQQQQDEYEVALDQLSASFMALRGGWQPHHNIASSSSSISSPPTNSSSPVKNGRSISSLNTTATSSILNDRFYTSVDKSRNIEIARRQWETSVNEELLSIALEQRQPLIKLKPTNVSASGNNSQKENDKNNIDEKHDDPYAGSGDDSGGDNSERPSSQEKVQLRFLYDCDDLLDAITAILPNTRNSNQNKLQRHGPGSSSSNSIRLSGGGSLGMAPLDILDGSLWGLVKVNLTSPDVFQLRRRFKALSPESWQVGLDDFALLGTKAVMQQLPPTPLAKAAKMAQQQANLAAAAVAAANDANNNGVARSSGGALGLGLAGSSGSLAVAEAALAKAEAAAQAEAANNKNMSTDPKDVQELVEMFVNVSSRRAQAVLNHSYIPTARHFACSGVPTGARAQLWRLLLGLSPMRSPGEILKMKQQSSSSSSSVATGRNENDEDSSQANSTKRPRTASKKRNSCLGSSFESDTIGLDAAEALEQAEVSEKLEFSALIGRTESLEFITDALFLMDIENVVDNEHFFPFEDVLISVVLAFSRDDSVRANSLIAVHAPLLPTPSTALVNLNSMQPSPSSNGGSLMSARGAATAGAARGLVSDARDFMKKNALPVNSSVPLSGVLPFKGFAFYVAPLNYVYEDESAIYVAFRAMYQRYWCHLNSIRSSENSLPFLCQLFEELLQAHHPHLFFHMIQLNLPPLKVAISWIHSAFVTLLTPSEVLVLWDRLFGFDDLCILPVFAAAVFMYRAKQLMACTDAEQLKEVISEGFELRVVPLLQHFLFPTAIDASYMAASPSPTDYV